MEIKDRNYPFPDTGEAYVEWVKYLMALLRIDQNCSIGTVCLGAGMNVNEYAAQLVGETVALPQTLKLKGLIIDCEGCHHVVALRMMVDAK